MKLQVTQLVALGIALAGFAESAAAWTQGSGVTDSRYTLEWKADPAEGRRERTLYVRVRPSSGWHIAEAAPATLRFDPTPGPSVDPAKQGRDDATQHSGEGFEFEAALRKVPNTGAAASGHLKFGICQGQNERCFIVRRHFEVAYDE